MAIIQELIWRCPAWLQRHANAELWLEVDRSHRELVAQAVAAVQQEEGQEEALELEEVLSDAGGRARFARLRWSSLADLTQHSQRLSTAQRQRPASAL